MNSCLFNGQCIMPITHLATRNRVINVWLSIAKCVIKTTVIKQLFIFVIFASRWCFNCRLCWPMYKIRNHASCRDNKKVATEMLKTWKSSYQSVAAFHSKQPHETWKLVLFKTISFYYFFLHQCFFPLLLTCLLSYSLNLFYAQWIHFVP